MRLMLSKMTENIFKLPDSKEENEFEDLEELEEKIFRNERTEKLKKSIKKLKIEYQKGILIWLE